jgi:hypothetical protein
LGCDDVWKCDGFLFDLLLAQGEEGLCWPGGVCEERSMILLHLTTLEGGPKVVVSLRFHRYSCGGRKG